MQEIYKVKQNILDQLVDGCLQQIQQDHLHPQNARPLAMHPDKNDNTVPNALEYLQVF
ncbi:MAG TPA: hypothetical protein VFG46_15400 [Chryseolinea sp.]|nr:hypothetical protein [Chryseolinea sp.]